MGRVWACPHLLPSTCWAADSWPTSCSSSMARLLHSCRWVVVGVNLHQERCLAAPSHTPSGCLSPPPLPTPRQTTAHSTARIGSRSPCAGAIHSSRGIARAASSSAWAGPEQRPSNARMLAQALPAAPAFSAAAHGRLVAAAPGRPAARRRSGGGSSGGGVSLRPPRAQLQQPDGDLPDLQPPKFQPFAPRVRSQGRLCSIASRPITLPGLPLNR